MRKTFTAAASEASSAGRLSVGSAIRFQSASIALRRLAVRAQPVAEASARRARGRPGRAAAARARRATADSALAQRRAARSAGATARGGAARAGASREMQRGRACPRAGPARRSRGCSGSRSVDAEAAQEAEVGGAAAQRDVLAVVEPEPVALERERRAAEPRARLVERHRRARVGALDRGREPGQPAADDRDAASRHRGTAGEAAGEHEPLLPGAQREPAAQDERRLGGDPLEQAAGTCRPSRARTTALRRSSSGTSARPRSSQLERRARASNAITSSTGPVEPPPAASQPKRSRSSRGR